MMGRSAALSAALLTAVLTGAASGAESDDWKLGDWKTVKADHFVVHYKDNESFAREVARKSDAYYSQIAADLDFDRHQNFWLWDNRVQIYLFPSPEAFRRLPGAHEWSIGMADYDEKEIYSFGGQAEFTDTVLPHEITHLIFRDFVGTSKRIPLWLDEGIAQWQEPAKRALAKKYAQSLIRNNASLPVAELFYMRARKLSRSKDAEKFYMQSVSLVDFLIRTYGGRAFTDFCRLLRDGRTVNDALKKAYPSSLQNMDDLDREWKKYASAP